jgi:hypothetical protein
MVMIVIQNIVKVTNTVRAKAAVSVVVLKATTDKDGGTRGNNRWHEYFHTDTDFIKFSYCSTIPEYLIPWCITECGFEP